MKVVCIGDSITNGQYLGKGEKAWPALLEGCDVAPRGVNGDTTRLMLERFPADVQELEPNVVVIQAGHNDANRWQSDRGINRVSLAGFIANLHEMIVRSRVFGAEPVLCTITPTKRTGRYEYDCGAYDRALRRVVGDRGALLVDVGFENLDVMLLADGIHLSAEGHRWYAGCVQNVLSERPVAA